MMCSAAALEAQRRFRDRVLAILLKVLKLDRDKH